MIRSRSRVITFFLFCGFSSTVLLSSLGMQSLPWYKKDYNLFFMFSGDDQCRGAHCVDDAVAHHDVTISQENYFAHLTVNSNDCIKVPSSLRHLHNYEFRHLTSVDQGGPSCAWYAAFNAKALEVITQECKQLTAANIREYITKQLVPHVEQNEDFFKQLLGTNAVLDGLKIYQTTKLIGHLGITNYYDIKICEEHEMLVSVDNDYSFMNHECVISVPFKGYDTKYLVSNIPILLRSIKANPAPVVHIVLTVPSSEDIIHAVLLTIIKRGDKKPLLVYLNSNGNSLGKYYFDSEATTQNNHIADFVTRLDRA